MTVVKATKKTLENPATFKGRSATPPREAGHTTFIQSRRDVKMSGPDRLRVTTSTPDLPTRVQRIREILSKLSA